MWGRSMAVRWRYWSEGMDSLGGTWRSGEIGGHPGLWKVMEGLGGTWRSGEMSYLGSEAHSMYPCLL